MDEEQSFSPEPHLERIAHFVQAGWSDPLELDLNDSLGEDWWPSVDGNRRLYAAIIRGNTHVDLVVSGDLELANELLAPEQPW